VPARRGRRQELTRIGAPLAFLAAFTILALLVHSALSGGNGATTTATTKRRTTPVIVPPPDNHTTGGTTTRKQSTGPPKRFYIVASGDTFGSIAAQYGITVERIVALNPDADSSALRIGQRIRVR
jgi:LysM repeat protein